MAPRRVPALLQLGCAHLIAMLLTISLLLVVDTFVVSLAYQSWVEVRAGKRHDPRLAQTVLIVGPLVLLFLQYWLYDRLRDWVLRPRVDEP